VLKRAEPLMSRRRQQTAFRKPDGRLDLFGVEGDGTFAKKIVEQERPSPAALSGKDRAYKAGRLKVRGAGSGNAYMS